METKCYINFSSLSLDPREATKFIADTLFSKIYPVIIRIRNKLQGYHGVLFEDDIVKIQDVYSLCLSQIKKCLQTLFIIFKTECYEQISLQESRQSVIERLSWCVNRLNSIEQRLDTDVKVPEDASNDSILATPMYFVNWIDHTFDVLAKLSNFIYNSDNKESDELYNEWKNNVIDCVSTLHITIDELLLSAMTLCRHCLPSDQLIIKARCQVVLRETKALLSELVEGDLDTAYKVTSDSLKLPIMPSNANVLIDVLKDVLYVLETNTNTALLALLVHCFSKSVSPVDILKEHFGKSKGSCPCNANSEEDVTQDCSFVKEFDLYNERLMQIGSFAMSCSSDQNRILTLRSGLASLEALDPHLIPALMLSPGSRHAEMLMNSWRQEVKDIRDSVFLIVDPAAFAEKSKQVMHHILLEILKENRYGNRGVCQVINIGCVVLDFFSVYNNREPDALTHHDRLVPLLADLDKVQMECKIVSNLLSSEDEFVYQVKKTKNNNEVSVDQLFKRLKLLYTLVNRINSFLHPKDNDDQFFDCELEDASKLKNVTHTVYANNSKTYVHSPRKPANISRSIFARTSNIRSSTANFSLSKLTKHLKAKKNEELSFSLKLDDMFNLSDTNNHIEKVMCNKHLESMRECSILYNFSPKKRNSLRKAVLNKHLQQLPFDNKLYKQEVAVNTISEQNSLVDEATSMQITDILNQMSDMTNTFARTKAAPFNRGKNPQSTSTNEPVNNKHKTISNNVLKISINDTNTSISKHIWNIPVNASTVEMVLDDSAVTMASNVTQPSNVTTLERISDIDLVESKLHSLKSLDIETSL